MNARIASEPGPVKNRTTVGACVEVEPYSRLARTNDEGGEAGPVTAVTFDAMGETFDELDELLVALGESSGP